LSGNIIISQNAQLKRCQAWSFITRCRCASEYAGLAMKIRMFPTELSQNKKIVAANQIDSPPRLKN